MRSGPGVGPRLGGGYNNNNNLWQMHRRGVLVVKTRFWVDFPMCRSFFYIIFLIVLQTQHCRLGINLRSPGLPTRTTIKACAKCERRIHWDFRSQAADFRAIIIIRNNISLRNVPYHPPKKTKNRGIFSRFARLVKITPGVDGGK